MRYDAPILRTERIALYRMHAALDHCNATLIAGVERHQDLQLMPCAYAMLISNGPRMLLHHLEVISFARRQGIGLAMLEALAQVYGVTDATWASRNGQMLASSFQRKHGAVDSWIYLLPAMPDPSEPIDDATMQAMLAEVRGVREPTATTWRQLEERRREQAITEQEVANG